MYLVHGNEDRANVNWPVRAKNFQAVFELLKRLPDVVGRVFLRINIVNDTLVEAVPANRTPEEGIEPFCYARIRHTCIRVIEVLRLKTRRSEK